MGPSTCYHCAVRHTIQLERFASDRSGVLVLDLGAINQLIAAVTAAQAPILITGTRRSFCAGLALEQVRNPELAPALLERFGDLLSALQNSQFHTCAYVEGAAIGGGFLLMTACHVRLAHPEVAKLGMPGPSVGIAYPHYAKALLRNRLGVLADAYLLDICIRSAQLSYESGVLDGLCANRDQAVTFASRRDTASLGT